MIGTNGRNFIGNEHDRRSLSGTDVSYNCYPVYEASHNGSQMLSPASYHSRESSHQPLQHQHSQSHTHSHSAASSVGHHHQSGHHHPKQQQHHNLQQHPPPVSQAPIISDQAIQRLHSLIIEFVRARNPPLNNYQELGQCLEYMYKKTSSEQQSDMGSLNDFLQTLSRIQYYSSEKMLQEKVNRFNGIINTLKQAAQVSNKQEAFRQLEFISRSLLAVESELSAAIAQPAARDPSSDHQNMGIDQMRRHQHNAPFTSGRSGNMMSNLMNDLQLRDDYTVPRASGHMREHSMYSLSDKCLQMCEAIKSQTARLRAKSGISSTDIVNALHCSNINTKNSALEKLTNDFQVALDAYLNQLRRLIKVSEFIMPACFLTYRPDALRELLSNCCDPDTTVLVLRETNSNFVEREIPDIQMEIANVFFPSYAKEKAKNGDPKLSSRSLLQHKRRAVENLIQSISPNLVEDARASLANKILNELC